MICASRYLLLLCWRIADLLLHSSQPVFTDAVAQVQHHEILEIDYFERDESKDDIPTIEIEWLVFARHELEFVR
jgi:hypothetical protein